MSVAMEGDGCAKQNLAPSIQPGANVAQYMGLRCTLRAQSNDGFGWNQLQRHAIHVSLCKPGLLHEARFWRQLSLTPFY